MKITRFGLVISPEIMSLEDASNINGPCCIRVPDWCNNKFGKYYLYFAHHSGKYIRMAYADKLEGPWTELKGGVLELDGLIDAHHHIASPDIYIDSHNKEIRMYFHAPSYIKKQQWTYLATSKNGLKFSQYSSQTLAPFYLRIFYHNNFFYAITKGGNIWYSKSGLNSFTPLHNPFNRKLDNEIWHNEVGSIRHVGLLNLNPTLYIFYTKIGDSPEEILCGSIDLSKPAEKWKVSNINAILKPEMDFEGAKLKLMPSKAGKSKVEENALRDPFIFEDDGKIYLFYCVKGEFGIALSELKLK
jgi:hypothetical protein